MKKNSFLNFLLVCPELFKVTFVPSYKKIKKKNCKNVYILNIFSENTIKIVYVVERC